MSLRVALITAISPTLDAILHLIKEQRSTNRCQYHEAGLKCTDLCGCNDAEYAGWCDNDAEIIYKIKLTNHHYQLHNYLSQYQSLPKNPLAVCSLNAS